VQHRSVDHNAASAPLERNSPGPPSSSGLLTRRGRKLHRQRQFLEAYPATGVLRQATAQAGVTRQAAWKWRKDPGFREAMTRARQDRLNGLTATRLDHVQAGMREFEQHMQTLDGPACRHVGRRRVAREARQRRASRRHVSRRRVCRRSSRHVVSCGS